MRYFKGNILCKSKIKDPEKDYTVQAMAAGSIVVGVFSGGWGAAAGLATIGVDVLLGFSDPNGNRGVEAKFGAYYAVVSPDHAPDPDPEDAEGSNIYKWTSSYDDDLDVRKERPVQAGDTIVVHVDMLTTVQERPTGYYDLWDPVPDCYAKVEMTPADSTDKATCKIYRR